MPLLVIFGTEDQVWDDPGAAAQAYRSVPGAQIATMPGAGHSPNVEEPAQTSRLILKFAAGAGTRRPQGTSRPKHRDEGKRGR